MVDYLREENRVLRAGLRGKRLRLAVVPQLSIMLGTPMNKGRPRAALIL